MHQVLQPGFGDYRAWIEISGGNRVPRERGLSPCLAHSKNNCSYLSFEHCLSNLRKLVPRTYVMISANSWKRGLLPSSLTLQFFRTSPLDLCCLGQTSLYPWHLRKILQQKSDEFRYFLKVLQEKATCPLYFAHFISSNPHFLPQTFSCLDLSANSSSFLK